jgi:hypothetical protein
MRLVLAALVLLGAGAASDTAKADPYRWCADYGGRSGGSNCYFVTLEQAVPLDHLGNEQQHLPAQPVL